MERAFGLLKPDCLKRRLEKEVIAIIQLTGLKVVAMKIVRLTRSQVAALWPGCQPMAFYEEMVEFSTSDDSMVLLVEGGNANKRLTDIVGHYDPTQAKTGTIRARFGTSPMENIIHSSSDPESYEKESSLFF